jgi:hypothetical protein
MAPQCLSVTMNWIIYIKKFDWACFAFFRIGLEDGCRTEGAGLFSAQRLSVAVA